MNKFVVILTLVAACYAVLVQGVDISHEIERYWQKDYQFLVSAISLSKTKNAKIQQEA